MALDIDVEDLVRKARSGTLAANDPEYAKLDRYVKSSVPGAENAMQRVSQAGGANARTSVNRVI